MGGVWGHVTIKTRVPREALTYKRLETATEPGSCRIQKWLTDKSCTELCALEFATAGDARGNSASTGQWVSLESKVRSMGD